MAGEESSIVSAICDYLTLRRHLFWRNNNTPIYDPTRKIFRALPKYTMKGLPDIIVISDGRFIGIEVKRPGAKQSLEQKEFERRCKEAGGDYAVARSVDDIIALRL